MELHIETKEDIVNVIYAQILIEGNLPSILLSPNQYESGQGAADDHPDGVVAVVSDVGVAAGIYRDRPWVVQSGGGSA